MIGSKLAVLATIRAEGKAGVKCVTLLLGFVVAAVAAEGDRLNSLLKTQASGIPWQECRGLGSGSVPALMDVLDRKSPAASRSPLEQANAVVCLGVLGDPRAFKVLRGFLERAVGRPTLSEDAHAAYLARANVPLSLGMIANQSGSTEVIDYLLGGVDPKYWGKIRWKSPNHDDPDALGVYLAESALAALGVAARREVLEGPAKAKVYQVCQGRPTPCSLERAWQRALDTCRKINQTKGGLQAIYGSTR